MPGLGIGSGTTHRPRRSGAQNGAQITALIAPVSSVLAVGQSLQNTVNWAAFGSPANYVTTAAGESIQTVVINYIGDVSDATTLLEDGDTVLFSVTVTDTAGNGRTFTTVPRTVQSAPAVNTLAPVVSGTTSPGDVLTVSNGTWTGAVGGAFSRQWYRNGIPRPGATAPTYTVTQADSGAEITARVSYTNSGGTVAAVSSATMIGIFSSPTLSASDSLVGRTLMISVESLAGTPAASVDLTVLTRNGVNVIGEATGTGPWQYAIPSDAAPQSVVWELTATNAIGSATAGGSTTVAGDLAQPSAPTVSASDSLVGRTLTVAVDGSTGNPAPAFSISGTVPFSGTGPWTYTVPGAASAIEVAWTVTATNAEGSATSSGSETVPANFFAPTVTATDSLADRRLTITVTALTGTPAPDAGLTALTLNGETVLGDATGTGPWEYVVPSSGSSQTVAWTVTATNPEGADTSSGLEQVAADLTAPSVSGVPTLSGTEEVGQTLAALAAGVTGTPTPAISWQWVNSTSGAISGATGTTYVLQSSDEGATITVRQTATNIIGSDTAVSAATGVIPVQSVTDLTVSNISETPVINFTGLGPATAVTFTIQSGYGAGTYGTDTGGTPLTVGALETAPVNIVLPPVTGPQTDGETLTREQGYWLYAGPGSVALSGAWQNDTDGATGDIGFTYTLLASDVGDTMSVAETASPTLGAVFQPVTVSSASTGAIAPAASTFDPAMLFAGGRKGLWYDFDDTSTLWTTTDRTTNVAGNGDDIRYIDDKSGNGHDMQALDIPVAVWGDVGGQQFLDNDTGGFQAIQNFDTGPVPVSIFRAWRSTDPSIGFLITSSGSVFISCNNGQGSGPSQGIGSSVAYATNGGSVITPTPSRDDLHSAWITGSAVVSEAQAVQFPANVRPHILDYPSGSGSDGAADIFCEIWVEEPVTLQERADIVAYMQDKFA